MSKETHVRSNDRDKEEGVCRYGMGRDMARVPERGAWHDQGEGTLQAATGISTQGIHRHAVT